MYMCRPEFENGELSERPLTKKQGGWGLELKITKKRYTFLKRGLLEQTMSEKWNKQMYIFEKGGLSVRSRSKKWSL